MKQYRKKPVTIEAVQFDGLNPAEIKDFVGEKCEVEIYDNEVTPPVARIVIHTLEGDMEVSKGDYVIKGVQGEFYPCKPDIFQQTYEAEEPDKSLEEAAKQFVGYDMDTDDLRDYEVGIQAFIAGAEWQKSQMLKESPKKEIEEFMSHGDRAIIDELYRWRFTTICQEYINQGIFDYGCAKHFAEWQRDQMLKDAVEGTVMDFSSYLPRPQVDILLDPHKYHTGDKVRIVVLKEEEEEK